MNAKRASSLELFFDLVFVFAITQLARLLHDDHTAAGWAHAGLMAWLVWWAWSQHTWAGNAIDLDRRGVRAVVLGVAGVMLLAAVSIPDAFGTDGAWFAVPYVLVRVAGLALYWEGLRHDQAHRRALRTYLPLAAAGPLLVLAGGLTPAGARPWIWAAAVAADLGSVAAAGRGEFRVAPGHFAERHALIVIIALGESVIAVGATAASLPPSAPLVTTAAAAFVVVASSWWAYFDWVQPRIEHRLESEPDHRRRSHLARDLYTLLHLPIVAGTVVFAVGVEEAVRHPTEHLEAFGRTAIGVGLALFLSGFLAGNARATGRLLPERTAAAVAVVVLAFAAGPVVSARTLLLLLAGVLVTTTAIESRRSSRRRPAAPPDRPSPRPAAPPGAPLPAPAPAPSSPTPTSPTPTSDR